MPGKLSPLQELKPGPAWDIQDTEINETYDGTERRFRADSIETCGAELHPFEAKAGGRAELIGLSEENRP